MDMWDESDMLEEEAEMQREMEEQLKASAQNEDIMDGFFDDPDFGPNAAQPTQSANLDKNVVTPSSPLANIKVPSPVVRREFQHDKASTLYSSALDLLNEFPSSSSSKRNTKTPGYDLARSMQAERQSIFGKETKRNNQQNFFFEQCNRFVTTLPSFQRIATKDLTLKDLPNMNDDEDLTCILANGQRMFIHDRHPSQLTSTTSQTSPSLLQKPFVEVMEEANALQVQSLLYKQAYEQQQKILSSTSTITGGKKPSPSSNMKGKKLDKSNSVLWVDKYAPQSFTQLLSLENTNREVIKALKRWDQFVFKRLSHALDSTATDIPQQQDTRPYKKVILLCGPPGTGKTTLAHIAARHCGYHAIEINASDERSGEVLKDHLFRATQSHTIMASDDHAKQSEKQQQQQQRKPNCVIFDEIDGLENSKATVEVLLSILTAPLPSSSHNKKTNKSAANTFALTRPLICICNDIYAPVLRELKRHAEIFTFTFPTEQRLFGRLQQICVQEGLLATQATSIPQNAASKGPMFTTQMIHELMMMTGYDIRSAINHLQFFAMRLLQQSGELSSANSSSLTGNSTTKTHNNMKDVHLDAYQIWQRVFTRVSSQPNAMHNNATTTTTTNGKNEENSMSIYDAMSDYGDYGLLLDGIYENLYPVAGIVPSYSTATANNNVHNPLLPDTSSLAHNHNSGHNGGNNNVMVKYGVSLEWLSFVDTIVGLPMDNSASYSMQGYIGLYGCMVNYCHGFNNNDGKGKVKLSWPKKEKTVFYQKQSKLHILQTFRLQTVSLLSLSQTVVDLLSPLIDIIRPRIKTSNHNASFSSLPKLEQGLIQHAIEVMESYQLHFLPINGDEAKELITAEDTSSNNPPSNPSSRNPYDQHNYKTNNDNTNTNTNSFNKQNNQKKEATNLFLQEKISLVLEPPIDQLLSYPKEMIGTEKHLQYRHWFLSNELKQIMYFEQKKYAIALKETKHNTDVLTATPVTTTTSSFFVNQSKPSTTTATTTTAASPNTTNKTAMIDFDKKVKSERSYGLSSFLFKRPTDTNNTSTNTSNEGNKKFKSTHVDSNSSTTNNTNTTNTDSNGNRHDNAAYSATTVHFKFNKGYSNAVKRSVYIQDFL